MKNLLKVPCLIFITSSFANAHEPIPPEVRSELEGTSPEVVERREFLQEIEKTNLHESLRRREDFKVKRALLEASGYDSARVNAILLGGLGGANPAFPNAGSPPFPAKGKPKLPVILVDFKDQVASTLYPALTPAEISNRIFGQGDSNDFPYESMRNYYHRASNGQLDLKGDVLGWVRLPKDRHEYAPKFSVTDDGNERQVKKQKALYAIFTEAMDKLDATTDFSQFDNNNDGEIDSVVVLYAGPKGNWGEFFWAYQWSFWASGTTGSSAKKFDGKTIRTFVFQYAGDTGALRFDNRTLLHEFGHLVGIRDYYDYCPSSAFMLPSKCNRPNLTSAGPDGGVGGFDMMHANHANHNAYSRWLLDWIKRPRVVGSGSQTITLAASGESVDVSSVDQAVAIFPNLSEQIDQVAPSREMYIAEYRSSAGNDSGVVGTADAGLAVWHVAADSLDSPQRTAFDNSYTKTKHLRLLRSGVSEDFSENEAFTPSELFQAGEAFGPNSTPASLGHDGSSTGVAISEIAVTGNKVTAKFSIVTQSGSPSATAAQTQTNGQPANTLSPSSSDLDRFKNVDLDALLNAEEKYGRLAADELSTALNELGNATNLTLQNVLEVQIISEKLAERDPKRAIEEANRIAKSAPNDFSQLSSLAASAATLKNPEMVLELLKDESVSASTRAIAALSLEPKDSRFKEYAEIASQLDRLTQAIKTAETGTGATGGRLALLRAKSAQVENDLREKLEQISGSPQNWLGFPR